MTEKMLKFLLPLFISGSLAFNGQTYRAGIVEFDRVKSGPVFENEFINAREFVNYAEKAAKQGIDILVFPEYAINPPPAAINNQTIPKIDPSHPWNPCVQPDLHSNTEILQIISCAARDNKIAIVANILSMEQCDGTAGKCPDHGHYQFNSNAVIDRNGTLVARYHKYHLFGDYSASRPEKPEYVIFDLGFGKMATFVCFDVVYDAPAVYLAEKHGIRNFLFPTSWINFLPYYTAPQWFTRFAYATGTNLIAANNFDPYYSALGSGIFSSTNGTLTDAWDLSKPGRMMYADVPLNPPKPHQESGTCAGLDVVTDTNKPVHEDWPPIPDTPERVYVNYPTSSPTEQSNLFYSEPSGWYTYSVMEGQSGNSHVCDNDVCCRVEYAFHIRDDNDVYMLVSRSANKTILDHTLGTQVCAVLHCAKEDIATCGKVVTNHPVSRFSNLKIEGKFDTKYLFPDAFSTTFYTISPKQWEFNKKICTDLPNTVGTMNFKSALNEPLFEASIMGRMYNWDVDVPRNEVKGKRFLRKRSN